jgi:hypothetical protein
MRRTVKHVYEVNLYTDKVPTLYGFSGDYTKTKKPVCRKMCIMCGQLKPKRAFKKYSPTVCVTCGRKP